jgi:U4/U6.U5 tri-snRNP-associated protein 2
MFFRNVDFGDILSPEIKAKHKHTTYDLVANVVHDGDPKKGTYRYRRFFSPLYY